MGIFDKLMFWKQPEGVLTPNNAGLDINNMPDLNANPMGMPNMDQQLGMGNMEPGLPPIENLPNQFGQSNLTSQHNSQFPQQSFQGNSVQQAQFSSQPDIQKDMQILSLKLDAIKSELDSINQRVANIERIAENEQVKQTQPKRWY